MGAGPTVTKWGGQAVEERVRRSEAGVKEVRVEAVAVAVATTERLQDPMYVCEWETLTSE